MYNELDNKFYGHANIDNLNRLQLLNDVIINDVDSVITEDATDETIPSDNAIKHYLQQAIANTNIQINIGDIGNYFGLKSFSDITHSGDYNALFIASENSKVAQLSYNAIVTYKINEKEYTISRNQSFTPTLNVSSGNYTVTLSDSMVSDKVNSYISKDTFVTRTKRAVSYKELSSEVANSSIIYWCVQNGNEFSTCRFDKNSKTIIFEQLIGEDSPRGQWYGLKNSRIKSRPEELVPNDELKIYRINYIFGGYDSQGKFELYTLPAANSEPLVTSTAGNLNNFLTVATGTLCYVAEERKWYRFKDNSWKSTAYWLLGAAALDTTKIVALYTVPNTQLLNQRNSIQLEKYTDNKILAKYNDNVITVLDTIVDMQYTQLSWSVDNLEEGDFLIPCKRYYLYIDRKGITHLSVNIPYKNALGSWIDYKNYWRCVGSVFVDKDKHFTRPWDFNGNRGEEVEIYEYTGVAETTDLDPKFRSYIRPLGYIGLQKMLIVGCGGGVSQTKDNTIFHNLEASAGHCINDDGDGGKSVESYALHMEDGNNGTSIKGGDCPNFQFADIQLGIGGEENESGNGYGAGCGPHNSSIGGGSGSLVYYSYTLSNLNNLNVNDNIVPTLMIIPNNITDADSINGGKALVAVWYDNTSR